MKMLRTEMIDNLMRSYTTREIRALANLLGMWGKHDFTDLENLISDKLFDPGGWNEEFNKLAEMESNDESWEKFLIKRHKLEVDNADG
jgi:hypothetical protein